MKTKINSINAAQKLGAYSHGYKVDIGDSQMIFTTGQIALDKDGNVVGIGDIEKQTEFVFESLQNILNEAGASLDDVVKATIYVTDINDFPKISPIRNKYFKNSEPVSTLVEVRKLVKDGCKIEIEVIAVKQR
ncbi:hypothetical protein A3B45_02525 [Candidatus Daviesbacteria bacterium RIFCSPLOWO2_01_FULL_39_12]|uniref:Enamine deaminase RidA n=1 Tax=Candidatus Daviesbacteria bacterium RIFCSPLOWO2_01_FULL_39_12 TaxID=1797785 RepID=A0A1F5KT00_9BACT|nr:MAG: hypothetical protein A3D79_03600 [Candidatus Daviesbacteria bacterium RIFCSPHIGHO2_02_FULL_39_8]OGE43950.1 MAG: hypothetical protein A3B45_02525 [Candidatus Daviesbacteria bacterium RIFCSPLOWO2_01_FULL_39_12]